MWKDITMSTLILVCLADVIQTISAHAREKPYSRRCNPQKLHFQ